MKKRYCRGHLHAMNIHARDRIIDRVGIQVNRHDLHDIYKNINIYKIGKSIGVKDNGITIYWTKIKYKDVEFWVLVNYVAKRIVTALPGSKTRYDIKNFNKKK